MTHVREDSDASNSDSLANHLRSESVTKNMEAFMRRTSNGTSATNTAKRHSFVTVESLKEVRGRLRPLNSPSDEEPKQMKSIFKSSKDEEDNDDGIVTDDHIKHPDSESGSEMPPSKVKSYILGMEVLANNNKNGTRKPVLGTGSLESRTSSRTSSNGNNRSEEWYNRRKSYGFEQVHSQDANDNTRPNRLWEKNKVESSTDSGICRSSEAVSGLPWNRTSPTKIEEGKTFDFRKSDNLLKISHSIHIKKQDDKEKILEDNEKEEDSAFQRGRKTIVTLGNEFKKSNSSYKPNEDGSITVHNSIVKDNSVSLNGYRNNSEDEHRFKPLAVPGNSRRQSEPVTITIPIVSDESEKEASNVESKRLFFRQLSAGTSLSIESSDKKSAFTSGSSIKDNFKRGTWNGGDEWTKSIDNEMKRHSIAVDESKYVREGIKRFSNLHDSASKELANVSTSELVKRFAAMHAGKKDEGIFSNKDKYNPLPTGFNVSFVQNGEGFSTDDQNKKHKKVEFCKTEVHFAAESGRVNIVETDEKPPPSNPIRRRRRNSAGSITTALPTPDANKSNLPEIRFGDSPYEKQLLGGNEVTEVSEDPPSQPPLVKPEPTRPTVLSIGAFQKEVEKDDPVYSPASSVVAPPINQECAMSSYDEAVSEHFNITTHSSESMPRSILKNNRKPKPFILGASNDSTLESSDNQDEKWGVRLRPVQQTADNGSTAMWRSTVTLRSTAFDTPQQPLSERKDDTLITKQSPNNTETELQKMLKQLRPAGQRKSTSETDSNCSPQSSPIAAKKTVTESPNNSVQVTISSPMAEPLFSGWSVADRVKQVEEMKHSSMETKGYSTRINFGSGEATIVESGSSDDQQNLNLKHAAGPSLFQKSDKCKPMWLRREEKKQELQVGAEPLPEEIAQPHVAMANAVLPSYDPNRLRRVETLVSTRSGQPKITSIALRYEGDQSEDRSRSKSYSSSTYSQHQSAWKNLEPAPSHSYLPPRSDEKVAVGFTYYKPKEVAKEQPAMKDDRRDRTYKIEKHKDRLHNDEKMTREKVSPNREPLFSTERRSDSPLDPHRRSMSPPSKRPIGYTSPKKSSSPVALFEPERERSLSPSSKPHSKPETYFGDLKTLSTSTFSGTYRQESPRKSSKNYDQKNEGVSHQRSHVNSVTTHQRASVESSRNHCRSVPETAMNGHHSGVVETSAREERRRYNYESSTRSRSASRGRSLSPSKTVEPRKSQAVPEPETNDYDSPIYENIDDVLEESPAVRRAETDSAILEELTRAADQILQAVNGYTDEDSRASSDDDDVGRRHRRGRRGGRPAERMTTIAEAPAARRGAGPTAAGSSASAAASRRAHQQRLAQQCSRLAAHNSSTSSIESLTRGDAAPRRSVGATAAAATGARALLRRERLAVEEARRKVTSGPAGAASSASKPSSRTARLLQRASSREMLLKAHASSSEDVMSGAEAAAADALAARKARAPRRLRAASSAAAATAKSSSLTSASSGGRRPSPAVPGPQQPLSAASGRPRRREADVPKSKERSHGVRSDESRRRNSGRRDDDVTRLRGVRAAGPLHQHPTSSALITSSGGRERGASGQRRSAGATRVASAAAAGSSSAAAAAHAAAAAATATGPSHAVTRKPSSSRSESLSYSNKISK